MSHRIALEERAERRVNGALARRCANGSKTLETPENAAERAYGVNTAILAGGGGS